VPSRLVTPLAEPGPTPHACRTRTRRRSTCAADPRPPTTRLQRTHRSSPNRRRRHGLRTGTRLRRPRPTWGRSSAAGTDGRLDAWSPPPG
jgi:hypothetical protein